MSIVVGHSPSADALGGAAFTAGQGQRAERDLDRARQDQARREQLLVQQIEAEKNRKLRRDEQESQLSLYNRQISERANAQAQDRQYRQQVYDEAPARALEESLRQQELLKDNFVWQYNEQQKREMSKIQDAIGWTRQQVSSGEWTPEQAEVAEKQLWQRFHGIVPSLIYDDTPKPIDIFNKRRVVHPDTGEELFLDKNNKLYKMGDPNKEIAAKLTIEAADLAGKLMLMKKWTKPVVGDATESPLYSPEQALALAYQIYGVKSDIAQPAGPESTEPQITVDTIPDMAKDLSKKLFDGIIKGLEGTKKAAIDEAMVTAGEKFVAGVKSFGVPEKVAKELWLQKWQEEYDSQSGWKTNLVPKPPERPATASVEPSTPPEPAKKVWVKGQNPKTGNTVWSLVDANEPTPGAQQGQPTPPTTVKQRKQGETIAEYLKRTGQE